MKKNGNLIAQRLLEAFTQFRRLAWKQSSIMGLKPSEIMVLFSIKKTAEPDSPGIKVSDISSCLKVATPTITQLINGLETNGFVKRTMDKEDRRAVRVRLTDEGERVLKKAHNALSDAFNGLVEYLGEEKSNELAELLTKVFVYFSEIKKENN